MSVMGKSGAAWYSASGAVVAAYGAFWALFSSLGFPPGEESFSTLSIVSLLVGAIAFLSVQLKRASSQIKDAGEENLRLEVQNSAFGRCPFTLSLIHI